MQKIGADFERAWLRYANAIPKEERDELRQPMNTHAVMDHKAAFGRLDEGLRLALEQAEGDPATLAWLIGATLVGLGQQGYLDEKTTATVAMVLGKSVALDE